MRRSIILVALVAAAFSACTQTQGPESQPLEPCSVSLGSDPAFDLVLDGAGACAGPIKLSLRVATGTPEAPTWTSSATSPVHVEGAWEKSEMGAHRRVVVRNTSNEPTDLVALEWTADALSPELDRMLHDGYQSWSYAGVLQIPESVPEHAGTAAYGGDAENVLGERRGVSWWMTALSNANGFGLVAGADGATVFDTYLAADHHRLRIVQGATGDIVRLAPGESRSLDGVFIVRGDVRSGLDTYARQVAAMHPRTRRPALGGWGSWNLYYEKITAEILRPEIAWTAEHNAPRGLTTFLTDDGYMPHWGEWSADAKFGTDLASFAAEQTSRGLAPAIWVAPNVETVSHTER
ncbi:MAG TPA: hypothetical protein VM580_30035 [Labilithrix sp.]|nr:hypothetical protein [Labilithrix sp.]